MQLSDPDFAAIAARALDAPKGCGDNSCAVARPKGMATNGGCRCSSPTLHAAAAAGMRFQADVRQLLDALGQSYLLNPATASYRVARERPELEPKLASRWSPRHVWTLHRVPKHLEHLVAVRRRVLSDDDIAIVIETPAGTMHAGLDELAQHGHARGWGGHRADDSPPPIAGMFWGCELDLDIFDHVPTVEDRAAWLERRLREQELAARLPAKVWVSFDAAAGGVRVERCRATRLLETTVGDAVHRGDLNVELPLYRPLPPGTYGVVVHVLRVCLYTLAVEGVVSVADRHPGPDGSRRVYLWKPTRAQLAQDARR